MFIGPQTGISELRRSLFVTHAALKSGALSLEEIADRLSTRLSPVFMAAAMRGLTKNKRKRERRASRGKR